MTVSMLTRFLGLLLIGGVGLIVIGVYDFFIQAGTASKATTVTVAVLERGVPSNRHLIVTGGRALVDEAVTYYKTRRHFKVAGSEVYFIPIQDASLASYRSLTPPLLLRITEEQMEAIKEGKAFDPGSLHGVRMTHWDLESKAEDLLAKRYGETAVKRMVILDYEKEVTGVGSGLGQVLWGVLVIGAVIWFGKFANKPESRP